MICIPSEKTRWSGPLFSQSATSRSLSGTGQPFDQNQLGSKRVWAVGSPATLRSSAVAFRAVWSASTAARARSRMIHMLASTVWGQNHQPVLSFSLKIAKTLFVETRISAPVSREEENIQRFSF
jgi:hypothetical protein